MKKMEKTELSPEVKKALEGIPKELDKINEILRKYYKQLLKEREKGK